MSNECISILGYIYKYCHVALRQVQKPLAYSFPATYLWHLVGKDLIQSYCEFVLPLLGLFPLHIIVVAGANSQLQIAESARNNAICEFTSHNCRNNAICLITKVTLH